MSVAAAVASCAADGLLDAHRARLQRLARAWLARRPLFLDTETTGTGPDDEIVELAILDTDGAVLADQRLRPVKPIPPEATRRHGIADWEVAVAPAWPEVAPAIGRVLHGRALVAYNAAFDLRMLVQTALKHGTGRPPAETAFCAMRLYAAWYGDWDDVRGDYRWQALGDAAAQLGLAVPGRLHRAVTDAGLVRGVVEWMAGG